MIIIYHNNCPDGWCAAYIALKKYPGATLMPLNHGLNPQQLDELFAACFEQDVLMLDYSLRTRELNDQMANVTKSFHIYDHHKTAEAVLAGADYATFDMKRSGAGITFDYLFGKDSKERPVQNPDGEAGDTMFLYAPRPWYVDYVEDQDLWNWALPDAKLICSFLMASPRNEPTWDFISLMQPKDALRLGEGIRTQVDYYTRAVVAELQEGVLVFPIGFDSENCSPIIRNYKTAVLNIPYAGVSEAGHALVQKGYDIGLAWFERGDGVIQFSLRSEGDVDVSAIAKANGGGGHMHAAGFQLSIAEGRSFVDKVLGRGNASTSRCIK